MRHWFHLVVAIMVLVALGIGCGTPAPTPAASAPTAKDATAPPVATKPAVAPTVAAAPQAAPTSAAVAPTTVPVAKIRRGGVLRHAEKSSIDNLDSHLSNSNSLAFARLLNDTLLSYKMTDEKSKKFELGPGLAESFKLVDPTTIEFKMRKDAKAHDGTTITAAVAKYSLERARTHQKSATKINLIDVKEVQAVDDTTLRVVLKSPSAVFPLLMTPSPGNFVAIISQDALEKQGEEKFATTSVGTGAMKLKEYLRDDRIVLEKFPGYWEKGEDGQPLPYLDGYIGRIIPDQSVVAMEMKAGSIDIFLDLDLKDVASTQSSRDLATFNIPLEWRSYPMMYFNARPDAQTPLAKNKKLREAAQHAVDRESLAKALGFGVAQPAYYPAWNPDFIGYDDTLPKRNYDLAKATQLLNEAGFPNGIDIEVKAINRPTDVRPLEVIQEMWKKANIRLKISQIDRVVWQQDGGAGRFEALSHFSRQPLDPHLSNMLRTGAPGNYPAYSNPEVDKLWDQAGAEYDQTKRANAYKSLQRLVYEDAYHLVGYMFPSVGAINKRVKNATIPSNFRYIWLDQ